MQERKNWLRGRPRHGGARPFKTFSSQFLIESVSALLPLQITFNRSRIWLLKSVTLPN
jgi:hypothetical protein